MDVIFVRPKLSLLSSMTAFLWEQMKKHQENALVLHNILFISIYHSHLSLLVVQWPYWLSSMFLDNRRLCAKQLYEMKTMWSIK